MAISNILTATDAFGSAFRMSMQRNSKPEFTLLCIAANPSFRFCLENLSQPLLFEKGTIFPWGLRRKKYELLPYEIYQTNNREIAFLRYDYTKDHINAASYKLVYRGQMECWQTLDSLYCLHNQENRPNGRKMRSLSVSDIIVMHEDGQAHAYYVEPIGYKQVDDLLPGLEQTKKRSVAREER